MRKAALITGVLGQDGTYLARWLLRNGYQVHGLIRGAWPVNRVRIQQRFTPEECSRLRFHTAALENSSSLALAFEAARPDEVYHLAGLSDSRLSFQMPERTFDSITLGTVRLLEAVRSSKKSVRFFLASSCEVFGAPQHSPQDESSPRSPVTPYGIAKHAAETVARLYRDHHNQFVATGILYNHESPLRPVNYLSGHVARTVAAIVQGAEHELKLRTLESQRDWSDARDFIRGFHLALQADQPGDYIFASGRTHTVANLVQCAFRAVGLDYREFVRVERSKVTALPSPTGLCGDASRAARILSWKPIWSFEETITDMVQAEMEKRPFLLRSDPAPKLSEDIGWRGRYSLARKSSTAKRSTLRHQLSRKTSSRRLCG